ncbi:response regulator [Minwuia sp.]|uniref:response regulator n=1 Tax=Minwuia sp. TaxID=2493630 RepID=UPI003A9234C6
MNSSARKRVLIVDDVENNARVLEAILMVFDVDIEIARNGHEAVQMVMDIPLDLILMDIAMPGLNGFDATVQIRKFLGDRQVPIIAITADVTPQTLNKVQLAKFDAFLPKPIDVPKLQAVVAQMVSPVETENTTISTGSPTSEHMQEPAAHVH